MKTNLKYAAASAAVMISLISLISCTKEHEQDVQDEYVYASVSFRGEITIQPLDTRTSGSGDSFESGDLLIVNVMQYKDDSYKETETVSMRAGAYTDVSDITIPLVKGGQYEIIACIVKGAASSASWLDFPETRNKLIEGKRISLFAMMINGNYIKSYKSYRGGQRFRANSDIDLNLLMVKNYIGVTLNYNDVKGNVMVFCNNTDMQPSNLNAYTATSSGKTILMKFSEIYNTGNGIQATCAEQCITTGEGASYDPEFIRGFDIRIARSLNGTISYMNVIHAELKAGDNIIINIEEADFTGLNGNLTFDIDDDSVMNDIYYN